MSDERFPAPVEGVRAVRRLRSAPHGFPARRASRGLGYARRRVVRKRWKTTRAPTRRARKGASDVRTDETQCRETHVKKKKTRKKPFPKSNTFHLLKVVVSSWRKLSERKRPVSDAERSLTSFLLFSFFFFFLIVHESDVFLNFSRFGEKRVARVLLPTRIVFYVERRCRDPARYRRHDDKYFTSRFPAALPVVF